MGRKKLTSGEGASVSPALIERIRNLATRIWNDRQSQMARDLDIDQASISRVLAGKQQPGAKLLEKLATWPGVNAYWLFTGEGEPVVETLLGPAGGRYRPIAEQILPGPPENYPDLLSGVSFPVAEAFYSPTSYWWKVPDDFSLQVQTVPLPVPGDLLLMETSPKWTRRPEAVPGKLAGFSVRTGRRACVVPGLVEKLNKTDYLEAWDVYDVKLFGPSEAIRSRGAEFLVPGLLAGGEGEKPPRTGSKGPIQLTVEDVVCVGIKLDRVFRSWQAPPGI